MKLVVVLAILAFGLTACGAPSNSEKSTNEATASAEAMGDEADDTELADEPEGKDPEYGYLVIDLPDYENRGDAYCSVQISRVKEQRMANVIVQLSVEGITRPQSGEHPDADQWSSGDFTFHGSLDSANAFTTISAGYEPPSRFDEPMMEGWFFDAASPDGSFALRVDGELFDIFASDTRGADNFANAPHLWQSTLDLEANLFNPRECGQEVKARAKVRYEGLCTVSVQYITL